MTKLYASAAAIAIAAFFGWQGFHLWSARQGDAFSDCRSGNVAGGAIGGPVELVDQNGATVTNAQIFAKPTLVYFGFTSCPDVCPLDNARNVEVVELLEKVNIDASAIFITVDPERDTPVVMKDYIANFGDTLIGLTGTPQQIRTAAAAFKVYYQAPTDATGDYEVDHTTLTYLMMPDTGFVDFFQRQATSVEVADKVSCFVKAS